MAIRMGDGKSKETSAFGKRKWRDYRNGGMKVPADLGGIRMCINEETFQHLQNVCAELNLCQPSEPFQGGRDVKAETDLFRSLLQASGDKWGQLLKDHMESPPIRKKSGYSVSSSS